MMKVKLIILLILFVYALNAVSLRILFTNDTHSYYSAKQYEVGDQKYNLGGYANLERLLVRERIAYPRNLTFDSGDQHTGTVFSNYVYKGVKGGAVVEAMNKLNYSAATFGNHEFDQRLADAKGYMKLAKFPYINSNLMNGKRYFSPYPYKIFQLDSLKVGVIGLILTELPEKVNTSNIKGLTVLPYIKAIDKIIDEVDKQSDLIVILSHIGIEADSLLASQLDSRVDIILGAHTHVILEQPLVVNGILITETGAQLIYLGELDVDVQNDRISSWKHRLLEVTDEKNPPTELTAFVNDISNKLENALEEKLGELTVPWIPDKYRETTASLWQAKVLYEEYRNKSGVDFSVINCGGIRTPLQPGPITIRQMQELVPFGNIIQTFTCKGEDIYKMLELNMQLARTKEHDIVQTYPISYDVADTDLDPHIITVRINGKTIDRNQTYKGVSHDYVIKQSDKYLAFTPKHVKNTKIAFVDQLIKYIKEHKIVGE